MSRMLIALICWMVTATAVAQGVPAPAADAPATSALSPDDEASYVIGPGDQLQVFVWRNPELSTMVPVRPDGKISTPLVNDMVAVGKSPAQLSKDIEVMLGEYIRSPQVSVIVTTAQSQFSQVKVVGQVMQPKSLPFRSGMTVLDAVLEAGGMGQFAAGNRAKIVRTEDGKTTEIKVRLSDLVDDGDLTQNVALQPGDLIVIPESRW